jgi:O-antigen ligase
MAVYKITLNSIFDAPLQGFGYGAFVDVFPLYRDKSISPLGVWDKAHNTYLEIFQGLGLVFGVALIACVGVLAYICFRGVRKRQQGASTPIAAFSVAALVAVHSLVDFSLQVQAVTLTFMAILGAGVAQSESSRLALHD